MSEDADVDRLKNDVLAIFSRVANYQAAGGASSVIALTPAEFATLRQAIFTRQSLSQEAVRNEALEEAHKEYGDVYTTMSTKLEQYESLLKRWLIRFGSAGGHSILYDETKSALKREPNAAGQPRHLVRRGLKPDGTYPLADDDEPAPAAPDVAEMVRLLKAWAHNESTKHPYDSYTGPNKYLIDLLTEAAALLARLRQDTSVLMDSVRRYGATMTNDEILAQIPGASDD